MRRRPNTESVVTKWTNGSKAEVCLLEDKAGKRRIKKRYRRQFSRPMLRELFALLYVSRLRVTPYVIKFSLIKGEFELSYIEGERVLEWVLARYGDHGTDLAEFESFHGLETNSVVARAFERFRDSSEPRSVALREAIRISYAKLHGRHILHGDSSPRNLIYDGHKVHLIDFDRSRVCRDPASIEFGNLQRWYGIRRAEANQAGHRTAVSEQQSHASAG